MLKLYCPECGALNSYVSKKPNFCQKCGNSFNNTAKASAANNTTAQGVEGDDLSEEEVTDNQQFSFDDIGELQVDFFTHSSTQSLESLWTSGGVESPAELKNAPPRPEQKYTMDDFKSEAGAMKPNEKGKEET